MKVIVLLNAGSGALSGTSAPESARRIAEDFAGAGVETDVRLVEPSGLSDAAHGAAKEPGIGAVVAGGGDGTVSAVAGALAGGSVPLGILPLGTLNHFAGDLGIPPGAGEAVSVAARGTVRAVDVGAVNGRIFLNNSSIGLYPLMVRRRDRWHRYLGKWPAMALAVLRVLVRFPLMRLRIQVGEEEAGRVTPFVMVANNRYETGALGMPARTALDGGRIWVYVGRRTGRLGVLRLALRAVLGTLDEERDLETFPAESLRIEGGRHPLSVAVDGEVIRLRSPLSYRILPGSLRVIAPPPGR